MFLALVSLLAIFFLFIYFWFKRNSEYWKRKNIPCPKPDAFFGNLKDSLFMRKNIFQIYTEIYNDFEPFPYAGFFKMRTPGILIRDPKLIYDVLTRDFASFEENDMKVDEKNDPLLGKNPFFLKGERWKATRSQLTFCFTSGKLKAMLPLMMKVTEDMVQYIEKNTSSNFVTMDTRELAAKFTTDNVASCGFGIEGKSFTESNAEFRRMGQKMFKPNSMQMVKFLLTTLYPSLVKVLHMKIVSDDVDDYFRGIIKSMLQHRETNKVTRNDFLNNVNQIKEKNPNYTLEDVTSHALSFFFDGYETSSITLSYTIYDLAANLLVQEKLRKEIDETLAKHNSILTYECLQEMTYLDCVISESLRLHPPGGALLKTTTKDFHFPAINGNKEDLLVEAGIPIVIPVLGLHTDPKYFPKPQVFDPERFNDQNKASIKKGTYLPFGDGPRLCLGQRFAILQIKVALVALIKNFEVRVNRKTKEPLEIEEAYFLIVPKGGLWIDYYKRK